MTGLKTSRTLAHGTEPDASTAGDTTTWMYDAAGRLARKEHADDKGTDYTHTAGQLSGTNYTDTTRSG